MAKKDSITLPFFLFSLKRIVSPFGSAAIRITKVAPLGVNCLLNSLCSDLMPLPFVMLQWFAQMSVIKSETKINSWLDQVENKNDAFH